MKTIYGIKGFALSEFAISGNAILGIRDSGKTYAGCEAAEEMFDAGVPSICFDPIGKWHSLRVPAKGGRGYPFVVAGGKFGDLPLTRKNCGDLVRGAMADGISLVLDLFSRELTKSDWRYIVQQSMEILLFENEDYGLRHVFIEEAGEFVPQRVVDGVTFSAVEKVVRMGGNSKLGCTLIHQRPADINKSVLELCANIVLLRQTGKNTLTDLKKWFDLVSPDQAKKIAASLPDLRSGDGWAFIHDLPDPVRFKVPQRNSKHPDRREAAKDGGDIASRAAVPATKFVEAMKAKLAEKAPAAPKAAVAQASRQPTPAPAAPSAADQRQLDRLMTAAREEGAQAVRDTIPAMLDAQHQASFQAGFEFLAARRAVFEPGLVPARKPLAAIIGTMKAKLAVSRPIASAAPKPAAQVKQVAQSGGSADHLPPPQRRVLSSIGFWLSVGNDQPTRAQVGGVAGYSPSSGGFNNLLGQLNSAGLITIPAQGRVSLAPGAPYDALDLEGAKAKVQSVLSNPERKLVDAMVAAGGGPISRDDLGAATEYSASSGGFNNLIGGLCTLTIFEKPAPGQVSLSSWAREVLA